MFYSQTNKAGSKLVPSVNVAVRPATMAILLHRLTNNSAKRFKIKYGLSIRDFHPFRQFLKICLSLISQLMAKPSRTEHLIQARILVLVIIILHRTKLQKTLVLPKTSSMQLKLNKGKLVAR